MGAHRPGMRALQVTEHGQPGEVLAVRTIEVPEPGPGEVRVKVSAASLNFNDIDRCRGKLVSVPTPPPFTLGMDVCGMVDAAGEGAAPWLGRRVVAITKNALGGIADYAIADAISVFEAPPDFDDVEAAAFLLSFQTSHLALFKRGRLRDGETLVVHSGASGLGTAGIQLGKAVGARVIAVAGGPEKGALCSSLGADLVINHTAEDFVEAVLVATGDAGAEECTALEELRGASLRGFESHSLRSLCGDFARSSGSRFIGSDPGRLVAHSRGTRVRDCRADSGERRTSRPARCTSRPLTRRPT
jgi:NADPH:quinone reductase